uniref:Light-mediated development protein DET1 n=1 Tax=Arundo donax TaxID=35708 RepID=A0A0A9E9E9_ARUDO
MAIQKLYLPYDKINIVLEVKIELLLQMLDPRSLIRNLIPCLAKNI